MIGEIIATWFNPPGSESGIFSHKQANTIATEAHLRVNGGNRTDYGV